MNLGQIYRWTTDKAIGHQQRPKLHVFICEADAREDHTFLFISSANYGCDYKILKTDYPFLDHDSFVSCGRIVCYSDEELAQFAIEELGRITKPHLAALRKAVLASDQMEAWEIKRVGNALNAAV